MEVATSTEVVPEPVRTGTSQSIDWYSEGGSRSVEVNGIRVEVRYVARKGRRARIAIEAPPNAIFIGATVETST